MRALRLVPLVYFVGIHGFVMFTPYAALVLSAVYFSRKFRAVPQPAAVNA